MDKECSVMLSSVIVSKEDANQDTYDLTRNWAQLSNKLKESNLVLDLINVLSGLESNFFTWTKNTATGQYQIFTNPLIQKDFGSDVFEMCSSVLYIRLHQEVLLEFMNQTQKSYICQSLSELFVSVLEDLQESIVKFHNRHVTSFLGLEKLFMYLKPARETLLSLSIVTNDFDSGSLLSDRSNVGVLILDSLQKRCSSEMTTNRELCQYVYDSVMESYFHLIEKYVLYGSVSEHVVDFFIKKRTEQERLDNYLRPMKTERVATSDQEVDEAFEQHCLDSMRLWLDRRYVPSVFKNVAVRVFEAGVFVKVMKKGLNLDLTFKNVKDSIADLENVHSAVCEQLFEHLENISNIYGMFRLFFNFYLFQRSQYINDVIAMLNEKEDLYHINEYLNQITAKTNSYDEVALLRGDVEGYSPITQLSAGNDNHGFCIDDYGNGMLYMSFDNLRDLTRSLQYFKYYEHIASDSTNDFDNMDDYNNCFNCLEPYVYGCIPGNNSDRRQADAKVRFDLPSYDSRVNNISSWVKNRKNCLRYEDPSFSGSGADDSNKSDTQDDELDSLVSSDNDYRNVVLCCRIDRVGRLVFTSRILYKYKLMFKLLFQLKYAEFWLNQLSVHHLKTSRIPVEPDLVGRLNAQLFTVARMNQFVKRVLNHFLVDVVFVKTSEFLSSSYSDFHSLSRAHKKLVDELVESLLLNDPELISALQRTLLLTVKFTTELLNFIDNPSYTVDYPKLDASAGSNVSNSRSNVGLSADNLNCLLRNPGYCKMVYESRADFERNLEHFKSLLYRSDHSLKVAFE